MKPLDASRYTLVKAGRKYLAPEPVCMRALRAELERSEALVHWLQPLGGALADQVPCLHVNGQLFRADQKLEKAMFRHIRLSKDFRNVERLADGTAKLRIPARLLEQKQKTSARFLVSGLVSRLVLAAAALRAANSPPRARPYLSPLTGLGMQRNPKRAERAKAARKKPRAARPAAVDARTCLARVDADALGNPTSERTPLSLLPDATRTAAAMASMFEVEFGVSLRGAIDGALASTSRKPTAGPAPPPGSVHYACTEAPGADDADDSAPETLNPELARASSSALPQPGPEVHHDRGPGVHRARGADGTP